MERLIMYACSDSGAQFCDARTWERVKKGLHGKVDYMYFNLNNCSFADKVRECMEGKACPVGGGHLCLK